MSFSKVFAALLGAGGTLAALAAAQAADNVQAKWEQPRDLTFQFMGIKTAYNCSSIEDRLESILRELGAKPDVKVSAMGCAPAQLSATITARIHVAMPVDAGGSAAGGDSFPAQRKTVTLTASARNKSGAGECEFLEQVRRQLLPALKLQVVKDDVRCYPGAEMMKDHTLEVTALVPVVERPAKG